MKALFALVVLVIVLYVLYHSIPKKEREKTLKEIGPHVLRLSALILVVVALAVAAYYLPVSSLLP